MYFHEIGFTSHLTWMSFLYSILLQVLLLSAFRQEEDQYWIPSASVLQLLRASTHP